MSVNIITRRATDSCQDTRWFVPKWSRQFICWRAMSLCQVCWYIQRRWARKHQHWAMLYKLIRNVTIVLRMYLILMVTNCTSELSSSKLKQIENRLRTSTSQGRLVNLAAAIMSIESDTARDRLYCHYQWLCCCKIEKALSGLWLCEFVWELHCKYTCIIIILIILWFNRA